MNVLQRSIHLIVFGMLLAAPKPITDPNEKKLMANVDHLIMKLPDEFEFFKHSVYKKPADADLCRYDWNLIGQDYRNSRINRVELYLLWDEEDKDCRFFPEYQRGTDSPRELFIHQEALKKTFGDPELIRLMEKCQPYYHEGYFHSQLLALPRDRLFAYIDDCLDHGLPFQIWNGAYSQDEAEIYAELSNYITTKFLVSPNRLLNSIMYTYTSIFSSGTTSIFYDQDLTDKIFAIDGQAMIVSLNIIYNLILTRNTQELSPASLAKLDRLSFSIIRSFPNAPYSNPPFMTSVPARTIQVLISNDYYSFDQVVKMSGDPDLTRIGFMVEIDKTLGDYFKRHKAFDKALHFYTKYRDYMEYNEDTYFKDIVETSICLSSLGIGRIPKDCLTTFNNHISKLMEQIDANKRAKISETSIRDLAKLTVLQQDTINLNAKIRWYFFIVMAFACLMIVLIFFLFRTQKDLLRKNRLIDEQRTSIQLILDEIADVIVKFDRHGKALPYSSKTAVHLFQDIENLTIFQWVEQYFKLPTDTIRMIQEVLRSILNEPPVSWDLNSNHLPREAEICGQSFAIEWTPILRNGIVYEMLISAHNLNQVHEVEALRTEQDLILALVSGGPAVTQWVRGLPTRLAELPFLVDPNELARRLHTVKGEARTLHLAPIVESCHRLEQILRDGGIYHSALEQLQLSASRAVEGLIRFEKVQDPVIRENMLDIVQRIQSEARSSMQKLGFQVSIRLTLAGELHQPHLQNVLGEIILHAVNNSLDHGFVRPREQGQDPGQDIRIEILIEESRSALKLQILDNGIGIDESHIRLMATEKNWQPKAGRPWTDFVFESGVSTVVGSVTHRSGRGVGLAAIKLAAQELGLVPRLEARTDGQRGTLLRLES